VEDLKNCEVGDCELKLSAEALARLKKEVNWDRTDAKAQVERLVRSIAVDYVNAYRAGGNARLAVYRDSTNPTFVANEFGELVKGMPELSEYLPDMRRYLLDFPKAGGPPTRSFIYWQEAEFGLKPHHPRQPRRHPGGSERSGRRVSAACTQPLFLDCSNCGAGADPSRGAGFWFITINRSRSDGLSGFTGLVIRGKVRESARSGLESGLTAVREYLEAR
jgi:hypothetical protein